MKIECRIVKDDLNDICFTCGISSIDNEIKNSYYPYLANQAYTYEILINEEVVGYYQLLFRTIIIEHLPEGVYFDSGILQGYIPVLHLKFVAISKDKQRNINKYGTKALKIILTQALALSKSYPIRCLTLDARNELVEWYYQNGFDKTIINSPGQDGVSTMMFFDLLDQEKKEKILRYSEI